MGWRSKIKIDISKTKAVLKIISTAFVFDASLLSFHTSVCFFCPPQYLPSFLSYQN